MKEENMNDSIQPVTMQMNAPEQIEPTIEAPVTPQMVEPTPVMEAPVTPQMAEPAPVMGAPVTPQMVEPTPVMGAPVTPQMVEPAPVMEAPVTPQMVEPTPVMGAPVTPQMVEQSPMMQQPGITPVQMTDPNQVGMIPTNNMVTATPLINQKPGSESKNGKGKVIIVAALLAIIVIGLGIFGFITLKNYNNPRTRFLKALEKYSKENQLVAATNNANNILKKGANLKLDSTLKVKVGQEEFINGKMNLKFIDNPTLKQQYYDIIFSNNDEEIINLEGLLKDDKFYFKLKEVFEKFYYIDGIDYNMLTEATRKDTKHLEKIVTNTMLEYFTEDKFVSSDEKITLNGKEKNTMKITITISEKDIADICKNLFTNILNDNDAMNTFVTEETSYDDVKDVFTETINSINEAYSEMETTPLLTYVANLDKYEIVKQVFSVENIKLTIEGMETGKVALNVAGVDYITGTFSKNNIKLNVNLTGIATLGIDITYQEKITASNVDANYNISVIGDISGTNFEVTSTVAMKVDNQNTIPNVDLSDAKSVEDITEEELNKIQEKIYDLPYIGELLESYSDLGYEDEDSYYEVDDFYDEDEDFYDEDEDFDYGLDDFYNEYGDDFSTDFDDVSDSFKCSAAYSCQVNTDGSYSCKYMNEYGTEELITCELSGA